MPSSSAVSTAAPYQRGRRRSSVSSSLGRLATKAHAAGISATGWVRRSSSTPPIPPEMLDLQLHKDAIEPAQSDAGSPRNDGSPTSARDSPYKTGGLPAGWRQQSADDVRVDPHMRSATSSQAVDGSLIGRQQG